MIKYIIIPFLDWPIPMQCCGVAVSTLAASWQRQIVPSPDVQLLLRGVVVIVKKIRARIQKRGVENENMQPAFPQARLQKLAQQALNKDVPIGDF